MVKPLDALPFMEKDRQLKELKKDVKEIIEKRIPVCEIVDLKYPKGAVRARLEHAMKLVLHDYAQVIGIDTFRMPSYKELFRIAFRNIDGKDHWFVTFDVDLWNERMEMR